MNRSGPHRRGTRPARRPVTGGHGVRPVAVSEERLHRCGGRVPQGVGRSEDRRHPRAERRWPLVRCSCPRATPWYRATPVPPASPPPGRTTASRPWEFTASCTGTAVSGRRWCGRRRRSVRRWTRAARPTRRRLRRGSGPDEVRPTLMPTAGGRLRCRRHGCWAPSRTRPPSAYNDAQTVRVAAAVRRRHDESRLMDQVPRDQQKRPGHWRTGSAPADGTTPRTMPPRFHAGASPRPGHLRPNTTRPAPRPAGDGPTMRTPP